MAGQIWIPLSLLSAFLMAVVALIDRYVLLHLVKSALAPLTVLGLIGLVPSLAILAWKGRTGLDGPGLLLALGAGLAFLAMGYFYFRAAQIEEISRVIPLYYLSPALVAGLAPFLLGERLASGKYLGIGLLILGAALISMRWPPGLRRGAAVRLMLLAAAALAAYSLATKRLLSSSDYWTVFALARLGMFLGIIPIALKHRGVIRAEVSGRPGRRVILFMTGNEVLAMAASLVFTLAASLGPITVVNALTSTQPFFVLGLSLALAVLKPGLLREERGPAAAAVKTVAILIMFAGLVLLL
jgi:drug/metabolite transporter (DMT)-like permease